MSHYRSTLFPALAASHVLILAGAVLITSCMPSVRGGNGGGDGDNSCFSDVDCSSGEEYC